MAIASDYITLQRVIADELGDRSDLLTPPPWAIGLLSLSPIQTAIQSAIAKWEREPFFFNELYDQTAFYTVNGQEFYTADDITPPAVDPATIIGSLAKITKLRILVNANRYTMNPRTWQYLEDVSVNPNVRSSFPYDFAYLNKTFRFYPIPAESGDPITITGIQRFPPLVGVDDRNAWTEDAFDLIRCEAKSYLAQHVLYDDDLTVRMKVAIYGDPTNPYDLGYLGNLRGEGQQRGGTGRIRSSYF